MKRTSELLSVIGSATVRQFGSILGCRVSAVRIKDPNDTEEDAFETGHLVDTEVSFEDGQLLRLDYRIDRSTEVREWFSTFMIDS